MDTRKLKEAIAEAEAEEARYHRLAADLRVALNRALNNAGAQEPLIPPRTALKSKAKPKSTLQTAVHVLSEIGQPMHIKDLVDLVSDMRGTPTPRASIESVLVTAIKANKFGLRRTAPGTFEVEK